ncbi:MFS transporter [Burkholderia cenocepacia]|uniref:MFS transporter n=1 Tax=Burkholderia cenocepacia TaxID=95486 RepID=UPI002ABDD010|nr:MFS transporter [Burkholderia cenocepacia]
MATTSASDLSRFTIISSLYFGCGSVALFMCTPAFVVLMSRDWHFTDAQAGAIVGAAVIWNTIGSLLAGIPSRHVGTRTKLITASVLTVVGYSLAAGGGPPLQIGAFLSIAALGGGVLNGQAIRTLTYSSHPHRYMAFNTAAQNLTAALLMGIVLPPVGERWGVHGAYFLMTLLAIPGVFMACAVSVKDHVEEQSSPANGSTVGIFGILMSTLAFYIFMGVVWTFVGSLGTENGLIADDVDRAVGASNLLTLAVCAFAARLERSHRTQAWSILSVFITLIGVVGLVLEHRMLPFAFFFLVVNSGWTLYSVVVQCLFPRVDPAGRFASLTVGLIGLGYSIGSYMGGEYLTQHSASACFVASLALGGIAGLSLMLVRQNGSRGPETTSANPSFRVE